MDACATADDELGAFDPIVLPCARCAAAEACLSAALPLAAHGGFARPSHRKVDERQSLYRAGEPLAAIYVVCDGSFKLQSVSEDGREQLSGVHLPGAVIGIEGIASGRHTHTAVALESSLVCPLPLALVDRLAVAVPAAQRWFHRVLSRAIVAATDDLTLLGRRDAEERLAAFLFSLAQRLAALGHSPRAVELRLTRQEIGSHLGLSAATVSRAFSQLQRRGVIQIRKRGVELLEMQALKEWSRKSTGVGRNPLHRPRAHEGVQHDESQHPVPSPEEYRAPPQSSEDAAARL